MLRNRDRLLEPDRCNAASSAAWKLSPAPIVSTTWTTGAAASTIPADECQA